MKKPPVLIRGFSDNQLGYGRFAFDITKMRQTSARS